MPVIAMTAEMGSLREEIAEEVAKTLNLTVMRDEVVEHVAERMHIHRSLINKMRVGKAGYFERRGTDEKSIEVYTAEEVFTLAHSGNVILIGWGAAYMLRTIPHVVCVRVCRPLEQRVAWLMRELDTDDEEFARREIERSDSAKAASIRERFGATWGDPLLFDIVINTGRVSVESGAQQIIQLVSRPEFQETAQSRAMLGDLALEAKVRAALKATPETEDINITIKAKGGRVALLGIVLDDQERNTIGQIVAAIDGVTEVDNQLTLMKRSGLFTSAKW